MRSLGKHPALRHCASISPTQCALGVRSAPAKSSQLSPNRKRRSRIWLLDMMTPGRKITGPVSQWQMRQRSSRALMCDNGRNAIVRMVGVGE